MDTKDMALPSDRAGGLRPEPAAQSQPKALIPSASGCLLTGWSSAVLAGAYHAVEVLRTELAQPCGSNISEALTRVLDAIEDADIEMGAYRG